MIQTETTPLVRNDDIVPQNETAERDSFQLILDDLLLEQNEQH